MSKMNRIMLLVLGLVSVLTLINMTGCDEMPEAEVLQRKETEKAMSEAHAQIGMPAIANWQEKKLAKMIFELRDKTDLICYAYYFNALEGKRGDFIGKCIGFGLPYSVQFTNPMQVIREGSAGVTAIPMPDPNGLYMPEGLSATWLMLINPETNEPAPVYFEPLIIVSPFQLH